MEELFLYVKMTIDFIWALLIMGATTTNPTCTVDVFTETFDDLSQWTHDVSLWGGGNSEFQAYLPDIPCEQIVQVENNILRIMPKLMEDTMRFKMSSEEFINWRKNGLLNLTATYKDDPVAQCADSIHGLKRGLSCVQGRGAIPVVASAMLHTGKAFSFKYGTVKVTARLPKGDWMWPGIWMLPHNHLDSWPHGGELDMAEARGNVNLVDADYTSWGTDYMSSAFHHCSNYKRPGRNYKYKRPVNSTWADGFHEFALDWTPSSIEFTADGIQLLKFPSSRYKNYSRMKDMCVEEQPPTVGNSSVSPFDKEFYLILNVAVGGMSNFFHRTLTPKKPWKDWGEKGTRSRALTDFYAARHQWLPTWVQGLEIKKVTVTQQVGYVYTKNGVSKTASCKDNPASCKC